MDKLKPADEYREKFKLASTAVLKRLKQNIEKRLKTEETDEDNIQLAIIEEILAQREGRI